MTIFPSITFSLKRLWAYRSLVACLIIGLIAATTLSVAVPLYADAANYNLLRATLSKAATESRRPPFSFIFHYVGSWHEPITPEQYTPVDQFMQGQIAGIVGLPASGVTRYIATDNLQLYPNGEEIVRSQRLDLVKLAFVSGLFNGEGSPHIRLVEGKLPQPVVQSGAPLEALVSLKLANDLGLKVGDAYLLYEPAQAGASPFRLPVRVAGIWLPVDPAEGFWFYPPESFEKRFLIPEETFWGAVAQNLPQPINEAVWRLSFDGRDVYSEDVPGLLERVAQAQTRLNALLPHTDLESSPVQALRQYRRESLALTGLLFVFSAPVLGLAFYFLGLVAATLVRRQRNEIAVLRSRGASRLWVTAIYGVEWSLLGVIALLIGSWLAMETARLVGQTQSFLDFSRRVAVPVRLSKEALGLGLLAAGAALLFSLFPAWQAGRDTIVSYKQERARARRTPLWQRAYLDMFLLLPALYGLYTFRAQGRLVLLGRAVGSSNPFENPLIFLLPTLFMVALSLLVLRLLPWLLKGLAWVAAQMPGTAPVLALRRLARSAGDHLPPLMLMMVTLSLAGFVASMAHTLDRSLYDGVYYEVGADLNLVEGGEYTGESAADLAGISSMNSIQAVLTLADPSELEVVVNPTPEEASEIGVGQAAAVQLANRPGKDLAGRVRQAPFKVSSGENDLLGQDQTARIVLEDPGVSLTLGEAATVVIQLERRENVLWLPPAALRTFQGRDFVLIQDGEIQRRADVLLGLRSTDRVEILEGLRAGQVVIGQ